MSNKPNLAAIDIYSEKFADAICDDFFSKHNYITGIQITNLTTIESVNLFVLKRIFETWQKEAVRIQSPYFDYSADSVRTSLEHLMNALSKNINISRIHFLPLLQKAVRDVLVLTFAPEIFYEEFFGMQGMKIPLKNYLVPMFGYIKIHPKLSAQVLLALEEEASVNISRIDAINIARNTISHHPELIDDPKNIVALFNEVLPVGLFELHPGYLDQPPVQEKNIDLDSEKASIDIEKLSEDIISFDLEAEKEIEEEKEETLITAEEEKEEETLEELSSEVEPVVVELEEVNLDLESNSITEVDLPKEKEEEAVNETEDSSFENALESSLESLASSESEVTVIHFGEDEDKEIEEVVNDDIVGETSEEEEPINDTPDVLQALNNTVHEEGEQTTLLDKLRGASSNDASIKASININQKFVFQKELFDNNADVMNLAIEKLDNCKDYTEAIGLIKSDYAQQYEWDFTTSAVMDFINIVDNKF
ncbi:hypothetical protein [Flammeovirga kamogawensis]|uniref:Uncharacterized protein n=1 Tax=Flammeovirga kamogawensis TaxID=373891 RepID=A0ABX8GZZ2_9BACT|nr:hypothetical protein [Flammeovirga kamogawensis]MBB6458934.1 hypothetical protein [Flammeovirga kamogawensis]QWG08510.1 hypothetical protein KM029_06120 [Flammeovirga kamogawensis]TRX66803.1 hypothetical protein EO216_01170 [Flammeovirga kamogawensis]